MNIANLFTLTFWFDMNPGPWEALGQVLLIVLIVLTIAGVVAKILVGGNTFNAAIARLLAKISNVSLFTGLLGLFFWFIRQQTIPVFSARFWWLLLIIIALVWLFFVIRGNIRYKHNRERFEQKQEVFDKYLPKSKK